jgi:hypothetical protein
MDAIGADQSALDLKPELRFDPFQIRLPAPLGFVIGVTDIVADRTAFPTNRANSCHRINLESFQLARWLSVLANTV